MVTFIVWIAFTRLEEKPNLNRIEKYVKIKICGVVISLLEFKPSTAKVGEHIPCRYSGFVIWTFDYIENKHDVYRIKYCMKKIFESLRKLRKNAVR